MTSTSSHATPMDPPVGAHETEPLAVVINYNCWLPLTENWIHTQASHLPAHVVPHVVCRRTLNLDQFPIPSLSSYEDLSRWERLRVLGRAAPKLGWRTRRQAALLAHVAEARDARLVHSHFGYTGYYSHAAIRRLGLAHVVTFYGVDMSALPRSDSRWADRYAGLFGDVRLVLCEGRQMAEQVRSLGCPPDKVRVHRLGVDLKGLPFRPRRWNQGEPLRILMASSFREKKGIVYGLAALGRLRRERPIQVTIIGDAGSNPKSVAEKERIMEAVQRHDLEREVTFLGYQPREILVRELYQHHVFLAPSVTGTDGDTEGGAPVVIVEAGATGMPVVSTRHADIPGVILDGVGGLLADERDVEGLVHHLEWLAAHPDQWQAIAQSARERAEQEFDVVKQGWRLAGLYQEALS